MAASNNENSLNVEESILRKLKIHESEREIINLRVIITNIVIPKLLTVDIQMVINKTLKKKQKKKKQINEKKCVKIMNVIFIRAKKKK